MEKKEKNWEENKYQEFIDKRQYRVQNINLLMIAATHETSCIVKS